MYCLHSEVADHSCVFSCNELVFALHQIHREYEETHLFIQSEQ